MSIRRTLRYIAILMSGLVVAIPNLGCNIGVETTQSTGGGPSPTNPANPSNAASAAKLGPTVTKPAVGNVTPLLQVDNCYLAGQPQVADLEAFKAAGVKKIISLRDPSEINWDERAAVEAAGLEFVQIPMRSPDQMTAEKITEVCSLLQQAEENDELVVLHCGAAVRASAVWLAYYCVSKKATWQDAETVATSLVKVPASWTDPVKSYVEQNVAGN